MFSDFGEIQIVIGVLASCVIVEWSFSRWMFRLDEWRFRRISH